jgi:hypothetical protein
MPDAAQDYIYRALEHLRHWAVEIAPRPSSNSPIPASKH